MGNAAALRDIIRTAPIDEVRQMSYSPPQLMQPLSSMLISALVLWPGLPVEVLEEFARRVPDVFTLRYRETGILPVHFVIARRMQRHVFPPATITYVMQRFPDAALLPMTAITNDIPSSHQVDVFDVFMHQLDGQPGTPTGVFLAQMYDAAVARRLEREAAAAAAAAA